MTDVVSALIGAAPATLAALAAWRKVSMLAKPLEKNAQHEKTLVETVDCMAQTVAEVAETVGRVEAGLRAHQAWHQAEKE